MATVKALLAKRKFRAALRATERSAGHRSQVPDFYVYYRAEALFGLQRYRQAALTFARAHKMRPSRHRDQAWRREAEAWRAAGQPRKALRLLTSLMRSFPDHPNRPDIELTMARCWRDQRQRRRYAAHLQAIWLKWPGSSAATKAEARLRRLARSGIRPPAAPFEAGLARAKRLRWLKRYDDAVAAFTTLIKRFPKRRDLLERWIALTYRKADRPAKAIPVVEKQLQRVQKRGGKVPWKLTKLLADVLARDGKVAKGVELLLAGVPEELPLKKRLAARHRTALSAAVWLLSRHGRYKEAYKQTLRLAAITSERAQLSSLAWLAYRAGDYDAAITRLKKMVRGRRNLAFSLYWQARSHAKAGRVGEAEKLYRQLLERYLRNYYGHLARSRMVELGRIKLEPGACKPPTAPSDPDYGAELAGLAARYGALLPTLRRAGALWQNGMRREARRELRLAAMDLTWAIHRGRKRQYRVRSWPERLWRGGKFEGLRWRLTPPERAIRRMKREDRAAMTLALGNLLKRAGLSYFGWRLGERDSNTMRHAYPRAYERAVVSTALAEDLSPYTIWAIMRTESAYRADAISRVYAGGLMQLMPHTGALLATERKIKRFVFADVFEPETNLTLAGHYLRALKNKFHGQLPLMAAAYNGGPHNVGRWLTFRGAACNMDEFIEEIPFRESRRYAKKIVRLRALYERAHCDKDDHVLANKLEPRHSQYPMY